MKKLLLLFIPAFAIANTPVGNIGGEIRGIRTSGTTQILFGSRYLHHASEKFAVGGAAYTGQISEGTTGSFSYGGMLAGYRTDIASDIGMEFTILAGGGGGVTSSNTGGGICLEPGLSFNIKLGDTIRASLGAGYLWLPSNRGFSGATFGARIDFLTGMIGGES